MALRYLTLSGINMRPFITGQSSVSDSSSHHLDKLLNQDHELFCLANRVDWPMFERYFGALDFPDKIKSVRLIVGLEFLRQNYGLVDNAVLRIWTENPYWQYFCGEEYFQHRLPIDAGNFKFFHQHIDETESEMIRLLAEAA